MKIDLINVIKTIGKAVILDDVTLSLESGRIYGLRGPNGSGKTMLMRLVAGLIQPSSGEVLIDGKRLGEEMDFPPSIGMLIENPAFLPNYTGLKNLELLASLKNEIDSGQIRETLTRVALDPDDKRRVRKYSLGMKQRLGIAAAIMEKPALILLDEPTNALDDRGVARICDILREERERGALIVMACHDGEFLRECSDEVFKVQNGRVERESAI